jgi:hypothetical protein
MVCDVRGGSRPAGRLGDPLRRPLAARSGRAAAAGRAGSTAH